MSCCRVGATERLIGGHWQQIECYACLYTSHTANMLLYSPDKNFQGRADSLPHEEQLMLEKNNSPAESFGVGCV